MSKFFSKDDVSSSEDESSSEDDQKKKQAGKKPIAKAKKFYGGDSDDDSDEEREVVKTTADKRTEALKSVFAKMKNHIKIQDFTQLQADFDLIQEELQKCVGQTFATDKYQTLPAWVLKGIASLEDAVNEVTTDEKKKMNKTNAQSYTKVKQKLKKYLLEAGDDENRFGTQLEKYRENPPQEESEPEEKDDSDESDESGSSGSDSSSSDEDSDSDEKPKKKPEAKKAAKKDSGSDGSSSSSSSDDDSEGDSDGDSDSNKSGKVSDADDSDDAGEVVKPGQLPKKYAFLALPREDMTPQQRRWKWVAFKNLPDDMQLLVRPPKEVKTRDRTNQGKGNQEDKEAKIQQQLMEEIIDDIDLDFTKQENIDKILTKYRNQQTSRKNFDINQHILVLDKMFQIQTEDKVDLKIEIMMLLISSYFTSAKKNEAGFFDRHSWGITNDKISLLLSLLQNKVFTPKDSKVKTETTKEDDGGDIDQFLRNSDSQILPALVNFIEKLDQQLYRAFQALTQTNMQYLHRLRDECILIKQCDAVMTYLEKQGEVEKVAKVAIIKLEHIYYKNDSLYEKTKEALKNKPDELAKIYFLAGPSQGVVHELVGLILANLSKKFKIRAILLQTFHHAIHNRYNQARDLIMKCHFGSTIADQPITIQIIYNRAIVQIGLSAFRLGLFDECNQVLVDVCQSPKLKESLAQGTSNYRQNQEKTLEEETEEKKRFIPPHLQINLEVIDCVYMTTSLLLEVPNISINKFNVSKKVISRNFRKLIEQYDMKGMQFVAQNSRDHIVFAARQLHKSQWREAFDNISQIKIFKRMKDFKSGALGEALLQRFKETAFKIYLINGGCQYDSVSIESSQAQFGLSKSVITKQISKLIMNNTIQAKIDHPTNTLIFQTATNDDDRKQMEHLQSDYLDKISQMVQANERCMELLSNQNYYTHTKGNEKWPAGDSRGKQR